MPSGLCCFVTRTRRLAAFAGAALGLLLIVGIASNSEQFESTSPTNESPARGGIGIEATLGEALDDAVAGEPNEVPDWIVIVISVLLGAAVLYVLSRQRFTFSFRRPSIEVSTEPVVVTQEEHAEEIAEMARDLIEELNAGDSPRYAIQRAYAAVETGFGVPELARKSAETPLSYLTRIFGRHESLQRPLEQLTTHFQHARFSQEPVDERMRTEAVDALIHIRDHYTATAWAKITSKQEARDRRASVSR